MAAGTFTLFKANLDDLRINDLTNANLRLSLHSSTYTPSNATTAGHSVKTDLTNEISGGGYAAVTLTGAAAANAGNTGWKLSTGNAGWTASGASIPAWRTAVLYYNGTLWGKTDPLIGYFLGDSTPADVPATTDTNTLTINCPATGWFDIV